MSNVVNEAVGPTGFNERILIVEQWETSEGVKCFGVKWKEEPIKGSHLETFGHQINRRSGRLLQVYEIREGQSVDAYRDVRGKRYTIPVALNGGKYRIGPPSGSVQLV